MSYATLDQFYNLGLREDAFVRQPRQIGVDVTQSRFILAAHGLKTGDLVRFMALGSGSALPQELSPSETYPATRLSSDVFDVGITIASAGHGPIGIVVDIEPRILEGIAFWSQWVDAHLAAYSPPLVAPIPGIITLLTCHLAAYDAAIVKGLANPQYQESAEPLRLRAERAQKMLDQFKDGLPIPGFVVDQTPGIAEGGATGWSDVSRGWTDRHGVLR